MKLTTHFIIILISAIFGYALCKVFERPPPKVGDTYIVYDDNRNDEYALTNRFPMEVVSVHRIVAVSNGTAYAVTFSFDLPTNNNQYPFPYNSYGPAKHFRNLNYYTRVEPFKSK